MQTVLRRWHGGFLLAWVVAGTACMPPKPPPSPDPTGRCEVDLSAMELFSAVGSTAKARPFTTTDSAALQGQEGDFVLENDRVRVVIANTGRSQGPDDDSGAIIDADVKRSAAQSAADRFSALKLFYGFGRTARVKQVEVLKDGERGGYAVIAATGSDALDETVNLPRAIEEVLGAGSVLTVDPEKPLSLLVTTYYVLSPGENRVRVLTAFCNTGNDNVLLAAGDRYQGLNGADFFNPHGCVAGMGGLDCPASQTAWLGWQADGVAYALRATKIANPGVPETVSAFSLDGELYTVNTGEAPGGLLSWSDHSAQQRAGEFGVLPDASRTYLRDLIIARDLGEVTSSFASWDSSPSTRLNVTVTTDGTTAAANVRVAVFGSDGQQRTLLVTDSNGKARADLAAGNYTLRAGALGYALTAPTPVSVPSTGALSSALQLGASQTLTVQVADPAATPLPAKVVVRCVQGTCANALEQYRPFFDGVRTPGNIAAVAMVGAQGSVTLPLPPAEYEVFVSRGPTYSAWPAGFPLSGWPVNLTHGPARVQATLAKVVDSTGWLSAAIGLNATPEAAAAEGVEVFAPSKRNRLIDATQVIFNAGLQAHLVPLAVSRADLFRSASVSALGATVTRAPLDWCPGAGPVLRADQVVEELRAAHPAAAILLHSPRGPTGALTQLKVDTATLATHATAQSLRTAEAPGANASDTRQFTQAFDAFEVSDGPVLSLAALNDWMTLLSRGVVTLPSAGVSAHTWVRHELPLSAFSASRYAQAIAQHQGSSSNGPFVRFTAQVVDGSSMLTGNAVGPGELLQVHPGQKDTVQLTVDVQAPFWMTFDLLEVHTHASGREATNGNANGSWPADRVLESRVLDVTKLPIETLPAQNGFIPKRIHVTERFMVSPTADTWFAVVVRATPASRALFPLLWGDVECSAGACSAAEVRPWAVAGPVLIDADGSGAYDHFPLP
ncbi:MAG: hypothetical protein K1X64_08960 [Myxococcaceae bacterium]|nr:hypothetical protein [Myxococcaceae bacterium]